LEPIGLGKEEVMTNCEEPLKRRTPRTWDCCVSEYYSHSLSVRTRAGSR